MFKYNNNNMSSYALSGQVKMRFRNLICILGCFLNACGSSKKAMSVHEDISDIKYQVNQISSPNEINPRKRSGYLLPDGKVLLDFPDIEYSLEEFENLPIRKKKEELGRQMIKLGNMTSETQIDDPKSEHILSDILRGDFEEILLKEKTQTPRPWPYNNCVRCIMEQDMEQRWVHLTQRLVLDKALENLFIYHLHSYVPNEEFLSEEILNKIENKFLGLGTVARGMSKALKEEVSFNKSEEHLDSAATSLFWIGLEIAQTLSGEINALKNEMEELESQLADGLAERDRDAVEKKIEFIENRTLVAELIVDDLIASSPLLSFLDESVSYNSSFIGEDEDSSITLIEYVYNYGHDGLEQGNNFSPEEFNVFLSQIKSVLKAKIPMVQEYTKDFIEAILTDEHKYIAPLMASRLETLNIVNKILLEHKDKDNIPVLEDYKLADHRIAKPHGMVANKFDAFDLSDITIMVLTGGAGGLFLRYFQEKTWDFSDRFPEDKAWKRWIGRWARTWWGTGLENQFGKVGKSTVTLLGLGGIFAAIRAVVKDNRRDEWVEYLQNARWAGIVSRSYANNAKLGSADLALNAFFDLVGVFTFSRMIRFHNFKKNKKAIQQPKMAKKVDDDIIAPNVIKMSKLAGLKRGLKTQGIWLKNKLTFLDRPFTSVAFVLGGLYVLFNAELTNNDRPGILPSMINAFAQGENSFSALWDSVKTVWNERGSRLNIITIGATDATFILMALGDVPAAKLAFRYAGISTMFEVASQLLAINSDETEDSYFSNQDSVVSLHSTWLDKISWERVWGHLGFISSFSIVKWYALHQPIIKGMLVPFTSLFTPRSNIKQFAEIIAKKPKKRNLKVRDEKTGQMVSYGELVEDLERRYGKDLKTITSLDKGSIRELFGPWTGVKKPLLLAVQKEVIEKQKTWFLANFTSSLGSNTLGTRLFVEGVNPHLNNTRIEKSSLAPEIVRWTEEQLKGAGYEDLSHYELTGLYDDISSDIYLLRFLQNEARAEKLSELGYEPKEFLKSYSEN